jgi:hypothetical protein
MTLAKLIRTAEKTKAARDELEYAMREIERVQIMDGISAIRMRSIARMTLKLVQQKEVLS